LVVALILCLGQQGLAFKFTADEESYVAAIAEHSSISGVNVWDTKQKNLDAYEAHAKVAHANGAQVLVFPEFGLESGDTNNRTLVGLYAEHVPTADGTVIPCQHPQLFSDRPALLRASCWAANFSVLLALNLHDAQPCNRTSGCPDDGRFIFNVNVLFDEKGAIVAKYIKSHVWFHKSTDQPDTPDLVTYKSSFGVEFGVFICFDIVFDAPPVALVRQGVKHFLYSVDQGSWGAALLMGPWSGKHHVTLLASNRGLDHSAVWIDGKALPQTRIPISANDSTLIVRVPK